MAFHFNATNHILRRSLILLLWIGVVYGTSVFLFAQVPSSQNHSVNQEFVGQSTAIHSFHPGLMRVDISISSLKPTRWTGEIVLSRGAFVNPVPLGISATSGTDFFFSNSSQNGFTLYTRSPETFCGIETTIIAPRDSQLDLRLYDITNNRRFSKTIFIERLVESSTSIQLDNQGTTIEIIRAPADELPVSIRRFGENAAVASTSIFRPNETLSLTVVPRTSSSKLTGDLLLTATARSLESESPFWSDSCEVPLSQIQQNDLAASEPNGRFAPCVFNLTTPDQNGVFEVSFELFAKTSNTPSRLSFPLSQSRKPRQEGTLIARRVVQAVVVQQPSKQTETIDSLKEVDGNLRGELLVIIDPTNSTWRKAFSKRHSLPFYKSTSGEAPRNEKMGGGFLPTFATDNSLPPKTFADDASIGNTDSVPRFRQIAPLEEQSSPRITEPSTGLILGQAPASSGTASSPFNMNIFGFGRSDSSQDDVELAEARERLNFVRRWELDEFNVFLRNLDRQNWTLDADLWEKPISSGSSRNFTEDELKQFAPPQTKFVRLEPNGKTIDDRAKNVLFEKLKALGTSYEPISWEAYPVPIQEPNKPHLLEIEHPTNFVQKLAVTILEQSPSGALLPNYPNGGIVVDSNSLSDRVTKGVSRFSMLFWPKTKNPIILISNASNQTPAAYGQIRIYRANEAEQRITTPNRGRIFSLAITKPNICRQFSGALKQAPFGLFGVEDWQVFDDSISRLLYYLSAHNYDAAMLAVVADGSTIYPSRQINPTPKYDGGVFLPSGGDQSRKDVLTLAAIRFESQGKTLIPLVKLNGTTPSLEQRLIQLQSNALSDSERAAIEGIEWIGAGSNRLVNSRQSLDGTGPYYNVLHPEVEKQVLAIIHEIVAKCAPYHSFGGLAIDVGADGWLALPDDIYYGMDDVTIARFVRESNIVNLLADRSDCKVQDLLLAKGSERYRQRAEFISSFCRKEWVEWRVNALYNFYRKIRATIATTRSDARLFLVASNALDGPNCKQLLAPRLVGNSRLRDALRLVGLDPVRYAAISSESKNVGGISQAGFVVGASSGETWDSTIVLLRPEKVAYTTPFAKTVLDWELKAPEALSLFSKGCAFPGVTFQHESEKKPLYDFDLTNPFRASVVELDTRALPSGFENRKRFAKSLAVADCLCFFDGGEAVPIGQEESLRDWVYTFKSLPAVPFKTWRPKNENTVKQASDGKELSTNEENGELLEKSIQPIVARYYNNSRETWIYLLNAAPFHTSVKITVNRKNKSQFEVFAGLRRDEPIAVSGSIVWSFTATPYDLVALRVDDPKATIESIEVTRPAEICGEDGRLRHAVRNFVDRIVAAQKGLDLPLRNGGFEETFAPVLREETTDEKTPNRANILGFVAPQSLKFKISRDPEEGGSGGASTSSSTASPPHDPDLTRIPGWRVYGPNDVDARLDTNVVKEGRASIKLSSQQGAGGIVSQPFPTPTTGRLFIQISVGVRPGVRELPLYLCLTGRKNGESYFHRSPIGATFLKKLQRQNDAQNGSDVIWHTDVVLMDSLPFDGLEDLSLCLELGGYGEVWIDQVRLYRLAFVSNEQTELMKLINTAEFRAEKGRIVDVMFMLESYWSALLQDQIPDNAPQLLSVRRQTAFVAEVPQESASDNASEKDKKKKEEKSGKGWGRLKLW